jgi:hypothetical protein
VTRWALEQFCGLRQHDSSRGITKDIAEELLSDQVQRTYAITLGDDFASCIIAAMLRRGYWIGRHPSYLNIVYVEGCDTSGNPNANAPNTFNDIRALVRIDETGTPLLDGLWEGTTEPGRYWVQNPMDPKGAARIRFGQYKAWALGIHHAGSPGAHEALVQVREVSVYRDLDRNYQREGDRLYTGLFGINQHWGYDLPPGDLGRSSAGCLVGRTKDGHREFMRAVKKDQRLKLNSAYTFISAVMPASALSEQKFDPKLDH